MTANVITIVKKYKIPKGSKIYLNGEGQWSIISGRDIFICPNDQLLSMENRGLVRLQYVTPQQYGTYLLVHSIDFNISDIVEVK